MTVYEKKTLPYTFLFMGHVILGTGITFLHLVWALWKPLPWCTGTVAFYVARRPGSENM